jgi:putative DNA primase/helicase
MTAGHNDVVAQMLAAGLDAPPLPLRLDGKPQRFGPKKLHWYKLREERTRQGGYVVLGSFGNWKGDERYRVQVDWKGMGQAEREELEKRRRERAQAELQERQASAALAAMSAGELWAQAQRQGRSDYLARKGVDPEACRYLRDGSIVVPLLRYDEPRDTALKALQRIWPDGTKRFTKGFQKPGTCLRLGHAVVGQPMLVCEGYATALTLRMAVDKRLPVVVALDAGNLQPVAELLRQLYPACRLLICADDDYMTVGNPGRDKALKAARAVGLCDFVYPVFRTGNRGPKDTDFNDLHAREGLQCVRRQLHTVLRWVSPGILNAAAA